MCIGAAGYPSRENPPRLADSAVASPKEDRHNHKGPSYRGWLTSFYKGPDRGSQVNDRDRNLVEE